MYKFVYVFKLIFFYFLYFRKKSQIAENLQKLGPSFIKMGQTLSVRPDIVGPDIAKQLSALRDKVPPFPFAQAKKAIEKELNIKLEDKFDSFEETPLASASIAQVYKAITKEGEIVAVKVLRPGIEKKFRNDIKFFKFGASLLVRYFKIAKRVKLIEAVELFEKTVKIEVDLSLEAAAGATLKENMADDENFYVPEVYWDLTSRRVFTSEWVDAIAIHDIAALKEAGHDTTKIAQILAVAFFNQSYRDGYFHADLHPGNLLIDKLGRINAIDFGIMGHLSRRNRIFLAQTLYGFLKQNYKEVSRLHFEYGYVPQTQSQELFAQACRSVGEPIVGNPTNKISVAKLLEKLLAIAEEFDMQTNPELFLFQRSLFLVEGIGIMLDEKVNMWELAEPWIEKWAIENFGIERKICNVLKKIGKILLEFTESEA